MNPQFLNRKIVSWLAVPALAVGLLSLNACNGSNQNSAVSPAPANPTTQSSGQPQAIKEVTLRLDWTPSAEYIAIYAAQNQGFYQAEGLTVKMEPGSGSTASAQLVGTGKSNFGFAFADAVLVAAAQGVPLQVLAVTQVRNPGSVVALEKSGIKTFQDLKGKKISASLDSFTYLALLRSLANVGLSEKDVTIVPVEAAVPALKSGKVDAATDVAYLAGTSLDLAQEKYTQLFFDSQGVSAYGQTIITNRDFAEKNPEVTRAFVRATLKGMDWVLANPEAATALAQKQFPKDGEDWNRGLLKNMLPFWQNGDTKTKGLGHQDLAVWQSMEQVALNGKMIQQPVDLKQLVQTQSGEAAQTK